MRLLPVTQLPAVSAALGAYTTILVAELVGDKSLYTVAALGLRFRRLPVLAGIGLAFMGKMLAAVWLGSLILQAPERWTTLLSAAGFFAGALFIWRKEPPRPAPQVEGPPLWHRGIALSFGTLFFTEWCDPGQLTAATLAARTQAALAVWVGGTLALMTKGTLAMTVGSKLGALLPERLLRITASATCGILGVLSLTRLFAR